MYVACPLAAFGGSISPCGYLIFAVITKCNYIVVACTTIGNLNHASRAPHLMWMNYRERQRCQFIRVCSSKTDAENWILFITGNGRHSRFGLNFSKT